jgi:hypothetical protein
MKFLFWGSDHKSRPRFEGRTVFRAADYRAGGLLLYSKTRSSLA